MSDAPDPRITPARDDLAAASLRGRVSAPRYVNGEACQVVQDGAVLRFSPSATARQESQLLYGELFTVYDRQDGWCWGQNQTDGYVGYVAAEALSTAVHEPDHMVATRFTHLYPAPDLKQPPLGGISMCAQVQLVDVDNGFGQILDGSWIYAKHLVPLDFATPDVIGTGLKFLGTPYLWGGRSANGVDCSSLVQLALRLAGLRVPRDSDMQETAVGTAVPMSDPHDFSAVEEGDLVFFPGHVGFFVSGWRFLHANAFDMLVSIHRFSEVLDRADAGNAGVTAIRRLPQTASLTPVES